MSVAICGGSPGYGRSALGVSHGRQQGDFGVPGIEPRMLDNYWNVGFEHGGVIRISGDLLRVGEIVEAPRKSSPQDLRSFSEMRCSKALCRVRRSSIAIESACEMEVATVSGSYGFTSSAAVNSAAAPAKRDRMRTPGSSGSWAAMYSLATRFMPSRKGVTSAARAERYNPARTLRL